MRSDEVEQVPEDVVERLRATCARLPEITEHVDVWAHSFRIRRSNVLVATRVHGTTVVSVRAEPEEIEALASTGHPWFRASQAGRLGLVIDDRTDWDELAELVTESYRMLAPKGLVARLDG